MHDPNALNFFHVCSSGSPEDCPVLRAKPRTGRLGRIVLLDALKTHSQPELCVDGALDGGGGIAARQGLRDEGFDGIGELVRFHDLSRHGKSVGDDCGVGEIPAPLNPPESRRAAQCHCPNSGSNSSIPSQVERSATTYRRRAKRQAGRIAQTRFVRFVDHLVRFTPTVVKARYDWQALQ